MECYNIKNVDSAGNVPLTSAARNGHEGVAKILLRRREINPDKPDNYGLTPLSHAAENGHEAMAKYYEDGKRSTPTSQIITA